MRGDFDIILGQPFLRQRNPNINWKTQTMTVTKQYKKNDVVIERVAVCTSIPHYISSLEDKSFYQYLKPTANAMDTRSKRKRIRKRRGDNTRSDADDLQDRLHQVQCYENNSKVRDDDVACRIILRDRSYGTEIKGIPADRTTPFGNPFLGDQDAVCDAYEHYLLRPDTQTASQIAHTYKCTLHKKFISNYPRDKLIDAINGLQRKLEGKRSLYYEMERDCHPRRCHVESIIKKIEIQYHYGLGEDKDSDSDSESNANGADAFDPAHLLSAKKMH